VKTCTDLENADAFVRRIVARPSRSRIALAEYLDREARAGATSIDRYRDTHALVIGAGGPGGMIALGLIRKGIGQLTVCDGDDVEPSNLNRQRFFPRDVGRPKAFALAENLRREAIGRTELEAVRLYFEEAVEGDVIRQPSICICAPDNDDARLYAAKYCWSRNLPYIVIGLSDDSDSGYLMVQKKQLQRGCWSCLKKGKLGNRKCGVAANINLTMAAAGLVLTACDAVVSGQQLNWNYRRFSLSGQVPDLCCTVPKWAGCPVCKEKESEPCAG
jgi:hypothetical protein